MRITGVGCCLLDSVYNGFDINAPEISALRSRKSGDGGLQEGRLVFFEDLQKHAGLDHSSLTQLLTKGDPPDVTNVGGPAIVAIINVAQMLEGDSRVQVVFEGKISDDYAGKRLLQILQKTPLKHSLQMIPGENTPVTMVLAGNDERTFVNDIAVAHKMLPSELSEDFFCSDIVLLGGTALVPELHDNLSRILRKVKANGGITVAGTVYDFRNEKKNPDKPWPLVSEGNWDDIDVLVMDAEEALRISGTDALSDAERFFIGRVKAFIITQGKASISIWAGSGLFKPHELESMPVSAYVDSMLAQDVSLRHDTTGCGDNFVGGVLASIARQRLAGANALDIEDCCAWGAACGGFTILYDGGTYIEKEPGEKASRIEPIVRAYKEQIQAMRNL
ncbi:MAG: carbohydrate kinase family protein [Sphaerochaetaceae bacterium]